MYGLIDTSGGNLFTPGNPNVQHSNQFFRPVGQFAGGVIGGIYGPGGAAIGGQAGGHIGQGFGDLTAGNWPGLYQGFASDANRDTNIGQTLGMLPGGKGGVTAIPGMGVLGGSVPFTSTNGAMLPQGNYLGMLGANPFGQSLLG